MKKTFFFVFLFIALLATSAFAGVFGGKWASNPTYNISSSHAYYTPVNNAVASWNSALSSISSNISIQTTSVTSANMSIIADFYGAVGWNAQGEPGPNITSGTYKFATMRINKTYMDAYTAAKNKAICTHEFGHILGLAHNSYTSPRTLMYELGSSIYYDQWGISTPQTNDIADLNSIY